MEKPKIRFKGYQEDWEQRKFGDLADYKKGPFGSAITKDIFVPKSEESIKVYEQQNAINKDWELERYFLPKEYALTKLKSFEVQGGDIIVSCAGTIGEIYEIPENADTGVINQALMRVRVDEDCVDKRMFKIAFSNMIDDFTRVHSNGSAIKNIPPFSDLKPMGVLLPSLQEQKKISSYFEKLDNLITLHQRKCEEMKTLKKYMLQKMFPQNGQLVPQIRFSGFTEDWEQRKFSELCDMVTVGIANSATHAYSDSGIVMFRNQNIKPNFLDDNDIIHIKPEFESRYKNKRLKKNDLLVARTGYPGTACVVPEKYENSQTFTTLIARPKNSVNPYFLCQYLNSDIGVKYFESTQIGGGQKNSGAGILNEMPVMLPSGIEEESKIAEYFTNFDHLITLHQQKCDELRNIKKFMLQNMFI